MALALALVVGFLMRLSELRIHDVHVPLDREYWMSLEPYSTASTVVVEILTDDGHTGMGQAHGSPQDGIVDVTRDLLWPKLKGLDLSSTTIESVWERLFRLTHTRNGRGFAPGSGQPHFGNHNQRLMMSAIAAVDIALWDVLSRSSNTPLYRYLGAESNRVRAYASGGYYGPRGEPSTELLIEELLTYVDLGYDVLKIKVGGLDLRSDVQRVETAVSKLPEDVTLLLDANCAYTVSEAVAAAQAFEQFDVGWLEEPVAWFDPVRGLERVAARTSIPIAAGESESHSFATRDLVDHGGITYLQLDGTRAGGISEWLRAARYADARGVLMAPHHDPHIHGHLLASIPNAFIQETFPNPKRDPIWVHLFESRHEIVRGELVLTDAPGLGVELNRQFIASYGETWSSSQNWVRGSKRRDDCLESVTSPEGVPVASDSCSQECQTKPTGSEDHVQGGPTGTPNMNPAQEGMRE